jgi:hypothetical protein
MAIKTLRHPISGQTFKLGRNRPVARCPRFALKNYLTRNLPAPPAAIEYTKRSEAALSKIYENDKLGDCVIAGMAHVVGVLTGYAGTKPFLFSDAEIIGLYSAIGGYVPGDPATDRGCDEQTALNYWENNGALPPHKTSPSGAHKIAGWMTVDSTNVEECRTALWLFENLYFGLELPDAWINPEPSSSGFVWDVAGPSDPENGHCVVGVGYTAAGITIDTWGMTGLMTNAAVAKYPTQASHGETYTVVSMDAISKANEKAPAGFDWSQLVADFDSMGGNVSAVLRRDKSSTAGA